MLMLYIYNFFLKYFCILNCLLIILVLKRKKKTIKQKQRLLHDPIKGVLIKAGF
jgi:hypothetical protein